ncbi:MAG: hypothetical protein ACTSXJ_02735 [Candidatus Baldrarchaeia archaeon]
MKGCKNSVPIVRVAEKVALVHRFWVQESIFFGENQETKDL